MVDPVLPTGKKSALGTALKTGLKKTLRIVVIVYAVFLGAAMLFEHKLIYFPTVGNVGASPGEEVWLTAANGAKFHGWYLPHPQAKATILHLHGNGGNLEDRRDLLKGLHGLGVNVFAIDYRGYGKSEGKPGESAINADSRSAYDWLLTKTTADRIVLHGESLGGGAACELAATVPCGGLILQSTFTSIPDMAPRAMPLFPKFLVRTQFNNLAKVARISCRKLFLHSKADEMIPFDMGEKLFAAAAEPKECEWFTAAGHNDLTISQPRKFYARLGQFLEPFAK